MVKILITGSTSRAASRIGESKFWSKNGLQRISLPHTEMDVREYSQLEKAVKLHKPDVVVNFAGITGLSACEAQRNDKTGIAWQVNVQGATNLARLSVIHNFHLIQISTASVFSGLSNNPGPYSETSIPEQNLAKLSWYGITKLEAEQSVKKYSSTWSIIRLASTVRSSKLSKPCLLRRWISQYKNTQLPKLFYDQYFSLTDLTELDVILARIIFYKLTGIFHVSAPDIQTPASVGEYLLTHWAKKEIHPATASLVKEITHNPELKLFCPVKWGLHASLTAHRLNYTFSKTTEIIDKFISEDIK
jgi:dTDP-4-dehydrorhamnose reductase